MSALVTLSRIINEVSEIETNVNEIKAALIKKGVESKGTLANFAEEIANINVAANEEVKPANEGTPAYLVELLKSLAEKNYSGEVLKKELKLKLGAVVPWVNSGRRRSPVRGSARRY